MELCLYQPTLHRSRNDTLGIASEIYVLSIPARTDRRKDMEHLRTTLGLRWTYMEAIDSQNAIVGRIVDSVKLIRQIYPANSLFTWPDPRVPINERVEPWDPAFLASLPAHSDKPVYSQPLVCATQNDTIIPYDPNLPEYKILTTARIACWYSHMTVIHTIANDFTLRADDAVIVLEDDVDMERDIQKRLQIVWPFLPSDWDIVYLGAKSLSLF
ncbi:hypothetical protein C0991_009514 [Blastosporella zonata]|nr:hypothetical protein C0991_009514 [Blastosporella zonata]